MNTWQMELKRVLAILVLATLLALLTNAVSSRPIPLLASDGPGAWPERERRISISDLREALVGNSPPLLLDLRDARAFKIDHPAAAVHAPADEFQANYMHFSSMLQAAPRIVLMCESEDCPLADRVARFLRDLKVNNVSVLEGGWEAYKRSNLSKSGVQP